jgi:hypothetical protein
MPKIEIDVPTGTTLLVAVDAACAVNRVWQVDADPKMPTVAPAQTLYEKPAGELTKEASVQIQRYRGEEAGPAAASAAAAGVCWQCVRTATGRLECRQVPC